MIEFENQDWVKNLTQADSSIPKKNFVDPNAAFPFQDYFSVGTIHGANMKARTLDNNVGAAEVIEIADGDDDVSVLSTKTQDELLALPCRRGERVSPQSAAGQPPRPIPLLAARPPTIPLQGRPGQPESQRMDLRSPQAPATKIWSMVGRPANSIQRPLL